MCIQALNWFYDPVNKIATIESCIGVDERSFEKACKLFDK